jgi:cell fate regulator YaaT (PSP1 superfamily)
MESSFLIRYGLWHHVGRFASDRSDLERGQTVVVRSHRGTELGMVLIKIDPTTENPPTSPSDRPGTARILRVANPDDLERARQLELERPLRFDLCRRIIQANDGLMELIDVEALFDDGRTVLHYLGPHQLDISGLVARLRSTCNIDVLLQSAGRDVPEDKGTPVDDPGGGCGRCGSGGGCSSGSDPTSHGSCSDCGIKKLLASKRTPTAKRPSAAL